MTNWKDKLRDKLMLVGTGILGAALAFLFARSAGEHFFTIQSILLSTVLLGDNFLLRKRIRVLKEQLDTVKGL